MAADVKGFADLDRQLQQLPNDVAGEILTKAMRKASRPMVEEARARVPKKSGTLARLIRTRLQKVASGASLIIGVISGKGFYAKFLEFGTKAHTVRIRKKRLLAENGNRFGVEVEIPALSPKPFLRPAIDTKGDEAIRILGVEIWKRMAKRAKGGKR